MECSVENCTLPAKHQFFCGPHYYRNRRGADMLAPVYTRFHTDDLGERLRLYAPPGDPGECWNWTRGLNKGYGVISIPGIRKREAHVVAWELANDQKLPKGMVIRHTCDNPKCCNPGHLLLGTHADNVADKVARDRQHRGEGTGCSKLTEGDVREIRKLARTGMYQYAIAERYDIAQSNVSFIVSRKTWAHVD